MLIKAGVDISRLNREIRRTLNTLDKVYESNNELFVVTSTFEGTHSAGSLHYADDAYDSNKPDFNRAKILAEIKFDVGSGFDVVMEADHIHIEYDPKT